MTLGERLLEALLRPFYAIGVAVGSFVEFLLQTRLAMSLGYQRGRKAVSGNEQPETGEPKPPE